MQITLKDLFAVVAFCAGMAWCGLQIGFSTTEFWSTLIGSALMSGIFIYFAKKRSGRYTGGWVLIPMAAPFGALFVYGIVAHALHFDGSPLALLCNSLFLSMAIVCLSLTRPVKLRVVAAIAMLLAFTSLLVGGILPTMRDVRELMAMRAAYPIVDLSPRLQYERQRPNVEGTADLQLSTLVDSELDAIDESLQQAHLSRLLFFKVHNEQYEKFIRAEGFGMRRMIYVRPGSLERPPLRNIPFNDFVSIEEGHSSRSEWIALAETGKLNSIEHLHRASRNDFLDSNAFGAVFSEHPDSDSPQRRTGPINVAGFIEHGMHYPPRSAMSEPDQWTIERLELVSLLKFDEPRVYVLDHLPRMDQLASNDAPTRKLDAFETAALAQLATEKDVVVEQQSVTDQTGGGEQQSVHYRMLGSLRAGTQCLECHSVQRGELLGAFSYAIRHRKTDEAAEVASLDESRAP